MTDPDPFNTRTSPSHDGAHCIEIEFADEIRFGPCYYSLTVDGMVLLGRNFGGAGIWSDDSRFFAIEEWLTTRESEGPRTRLVVFRFPERDELQTAVCERGFTKPLRFEKTCIVFVRQRRGVKHEFEIDLEGHETWLPFGRG